MSYIESSRLSEEDETLSMSISETQDSIAQSSMAADSMVTSTDIGDSSMINSTMTDMNYNSEEKLRKASSPDGPRFYHKKRFWAMCLAITIVLSAIFIPLLFLVIIPAVAQDALNKSKIDIKEVNITKATNDSFAMSMLGGASEAGAFSAKIDFNGAVNVLFNDEEIGSVTMNTISVSGGSGVVSGVDQTFHIANDKVEAFTKFAAATLTEKFFKWSLRGVATVRTLGMSINNLKLSKDIELAGSNGYNSTLLSLNVTQTPNGTLELEVSTIVNNPSPIGIELGDLNLQLIYSGTIIATVTAKGVFIHSGDNHMDLIGTSEIPTSDTDKLNYLQVMNAYLTNTPIVTSAKVLSVISPRGDKVKWLNDAVASLNLTTTVGGVPDPPQYITNVDFGEVSLKFTADAPYSPTISAKNASAQFQLPFHIDFQILAVGQDITLFDQGKPIASISTPEGNVTTTSTGISLDLPETQLKVIDNDAFEDFLVGFTATSGSNVDIAGKTNARVKSLLGDNVPIDGIPFKLTVFFQGFNQFNSGGTPPTVTNFTIVNTGNPNQLVLSTIVAMNNPARYSFSAGSVTLDVFYQEVKIGTAVIQDLSIVPGPNSLGIVTTLDNPTQSPGRDILTSFITGQSITISIRGNDNSTNITSLVKAFKAINITSTIPPLAKQLLPKAAPIS